MEEGYRILEHPADVGIEAFGNTLKDAFEYAALGLTSIIVEPASVDPSEQRFVSLKGTDPENLLVRWLSEIIYLYDGEDFLLSDVNISRLAHGELEATLAGEKMNESKHKLKMDVKAITYHQLMVEEEPEGVLLRVFLDI
ncbi:MAG: archease [Ignavibacteriales bacterium]|nr:archease [Ignavibacteriales bacterium]